MTRWGPYAPLPTGRPGPVPGRFGHSVTVGKPPKGDHDHHPEPTLQVSKGRGGLQIPWSEIEWIEADGDYARVHVGERTHLVSARMKELEQELSDPRFVRVHRSAIVNVARVQEVRHRSHGDFEVELADGTLVRVSRTRRDALLESWNAGA